MRGHRGGAERASSKAAEAFPSRRQAACAGLRREYYPAFVRDLVDYDYDDKLDDEAKVFLAAFTEEFYRGYRLKRETQLHGLPHIRQANAEIQRRRRGQDVLAFGAHRTESPPETEPRLGVNERERDMVDALDERRAAAGARRK